MKIRFTSSTNVPYGQFVIEAENEADRAVLGCFLTPSIQGLHKEWKFVLHGRGWNCDHVDGGPYSMNFGWAKRSADPTIPEHVK